MTNLNSNNAKVEYPCSWGFKVIGTDEDVVRQATLLVLEETCAGRDYSLDLSNVSGKGKYVSLNLHLQVNDEIDRNAIFAALAENSDIMMVI